MNIYQLQYVVFYDQDNQWLAFYPTVEIAQRKEATACIAAFLKNGGDPQFNEFFKQHLDHMFNQAITIDVSALLKNLSTLSFSTAHENYKSIILQYSQKNLTTHDESIIKTIFMSAFQKYFGLNYHQRHTTTLNHHNAGFYLTPDIYIQDMSYGDFIKTQQKTFEDFFGVVPKSDTYHRNIDEPNAYRKAAVDSLVDEEAQKLYNEIFPKNPDAFINTSNTTTNPQGFSAKDSSASTPQVQTEGWSLFWSDSKEEKNPQLDTSPRRKKP